MKWFGLSRDEGSRRIADIRTHDLLKARLLYVRQDFVEVLEELTDADLSRRPADDLPSVAGLLNEMANKEKELIAWLQSGDWPDDDPDAFEETATLAEIRSVFATLREQTLLYIDSLDEEGLEELVPCPEKWWEALRLEACPRSEILRNLAAHEWYHTGQLIVYMHARSES
ncbi:MAG: DinB family protein [Acidimicrobiia bacterium]